MSDEIEKQEIPQEELEAQDAEQLPDREAMSLINANVAAPVNAAVAANVLSDGSTAIANAEQTADIDQGN
jgi:UDP-N-acetylglucosamine enolpyruvyl transferase